MASGASLGSQPGVTPSLASGDAPAGVPRRPEEGSCPGEIQTDLVQRRPVSCGVTVQTFHHLGECVGVVFRAV